MEELKRELIKKHLSFGNGDYFQASVKHYLETGKASGSFFMALKAMMDEYAETKVDN
jgi:hypothetical protein|tara:strand:- start:80 stop:250 length:171 start_codon:yes stop_codon:yes gene_type:complete